MPFILHGKQRQVYAKTTCIEPSGKLKVPMSFATAVIITLGIIFGLGAILKLPYVKELTNPSLFFVKR